jgi:uncharacterized membrane protein YdfJ with MMPL/SSD domain
MGRLRRIAEIPAGSWTKWVVVAFWLVVLILAFPLSSRLTGAEKNNASAWLPGSAESTKVLDVQSRFQSPNIYTGVVVYVRDSGITAADRAKAAANARQFAGVHGVLPRRIVGPVESSDGKAIATTLQVDLGSKGWAGASTATDSLRAIIISSNPNGLVYHITGPLGIAADSNNEFKGIDSTLLFSAVAVVIVILLITYRSPTLWILPVVSSGVALIIAEAVVYLLAAHAGLTVNAQSAGILYVLVFGASTDYALLIVARYLDVQRADAHDRNLIIPVILVVVLIILGLLLRALVAPLILTATVVLSFAAALGISAVFFNHVFGFGGADTSFPLLVFLFLVALGIDYNIFLMTRVREEALRRDARHGAIVGLATTGGVITSAGFVLAGTFAVLATIPATFLTELGFAVAFGILLDTIVVRSVLVTALNLDLGRWMWWPSALARKPDPAVNDLGRERADALVAR